MDNIIYVPSAKMDFHEFNPCSPGFGRGHTMSLKYHSILNYFMCMVIYFVHYITFKIYSCMLYITCTLSLCLKQDSPSWTTTPGQFGGPSFMRC